MEINEYQALALRTSNSEMSEDLILNGILGLCGETGEVSDHVKKSLFQGHEFDKEQVINELGDVCWYVAILAKGLDVDLETVMQKNIDKLKERYPDGFAADKSINRKGDLNND
jgi:NTP pyrophosphatase (non-canonical NTP hydrolase)